MILGQTIRLNPTAKQANALARAAGCARKAYNWGLDEWNRQRAAGLKPTIGAIKKQFNEIKGAEFPWIYESPKDANQQAFADLRRAFANFFRWQRERVGPKVGYPTFHKKGRRDAFYVSNDRFHFHEDEKRVYLPVIGSVKMRERLRFDGKILSARVSRRADEWFLSVQVEGEFRRPNVHLRPSVGVDLGVKTALVVSRGGGEDGSSPEPIPGPKPLKHDLKALKRANRTLHRRQKGSRNRYKARLKVARIHQRVANVRKDFLHKVTTRLCRENQAIVIEDLNVAGMLKNHRLARAISDVGFGMFRVFLQYKAPIFGSTVTVADRWFPSSKTCHRCGAKKDHIDLSERTFRCEACGLVVDRDDNASLNLEQYPSLVPAAYRGEPSQDSPETTPMEINTSTRRPRRASVVVEVGPKPCALTRTI